MTPKDDVPIDYLRQIFDYDPETGVLTHRGRFNVKAGTIAGTVKSGGYIGVKIHQKGYYVHRIIWAMVTGEYPKDQIDHINLNKADNRWSNLRQATHGTNLGNTYPRNPQKLKGAFHASKNRWRARCRKLDLGYFLTEEAAHAAYVDAARYVFGEFAHA